jgi:methylglyoxal synthase
MEKYIALIAHDGKKKDLIEWVEWNATSISQHHVICTGTTGLLVADALRKKGVVEPKVKRVASGPYGGDQQIGHFIVNGDIVAMFFFWDPMEPHPHDVDVKALLRVANIYNIPTACNKATADLIVSSPMFMADYLEDSIG